MTVPHLRPGRSWPILFLAVVGLLVAWTVERQSVQRANRLHRAGALPDAASIYAQRLASDSTDHRLHYNLGTTRLGAGVSDVGAELASGTASADPDVRVRSHYNLGLWNLGRALEAASRDSARAHASASIEAGKEALRLSPGRVDARWNLAIAQRMLDSIQSDDGRAGTETVDGSAQADELVRTDEARDLQDESPVGDGPQEGEEETLAESDETGPLSVLEADDILGSAHLDPSIMIRKLLAFEGRAQRRTRLGRTTPRW
jgi:hypothetical protein